MKETIILACLISYQQFLNGLLLLLSKGILNSLFKLYKYHFIWVMPFYSNVICFCINKQLNY
jgi:hypothetical protein